MAKSELLQSGVLNVSARHGSQSRVAAPTWKVALRTEPVETILLAGLLLGLAWAPFWIGGNMPFAWGVNGLVFPGLALLYEASLLARGRRHAFSIKRLAIPAVLFLLVVGWIGVQMSPAVLPGYAHPIWSMAGEALSRPLSGAISVNPEASALALMRLLTDASLFWVAVQLCRSPQRAQLLLEGLVAIVAVYCAYGLILSAVFGGGIPFFDAPSGGGVVRSTFVN